MAKKKKKDKKRKSRESFLISIVRIPFRIMPQSFLSWGGKKVPKKMKKKLNHYVYPYKPIRIKSIIIKIINIFPEKVRKPLIRTGYKYLHLINLRNIISKRKHRKALKLILSDHRGQQIIVYPPIIDWGWMKQRPHHIMEGLSRKGYLVFWCTNNLREDRVDGFLEINPNFFLCSDISLLIRDISNLIFFTSSVEHNRWIRQAKSPQVIYDYLDDLGVYISGNDNYLAKEHEYLLENASLVVTTADKLADQIKKIRDDFVVAPNAADLDFFALKKKPLVPKDIKPLIKKPVVGYYGAIAKWFDYSMLIYAAKNMPDINFILIGPDYDDEMKKHHLDAYKNIHWLGLKNYDELPQYLYYFDVAILPFVKNKVTDAVSPVKIFEYMSGNKPIVTSDMHECTKYKSILIAKDNEQFVDSIRKALKLKNDKKYLELLAKDAKNNTWQVRTDKIAAAMDKTKKKIL